MTSLDSAISETGWIVSRIYEACSARAGREPRRGYLGMSQIGGECELKIWLDVNEGSPAPLDGRLARIFDNGNAVEERVVADLLEAGYPIDGRQMAFEDFGGRFKGHCDGVIHGITKEPHILEIKSANDSSFKNFKAHGLASKPAYAGQVQCYMGYSGLKRTLFVVENKNSQELYMERVAFHRPAFDALREKAWRILDSPLPPLPRKNSGCWWCDYREDRCPA